MAAGNTYVAIAEQTLGTAAASVTFSSISGAYTDLVFVVNPMGASVSQYSKNYSIHGDTRFKLQPNRFSRHMVVAQFPTQMQTKQFGVLLVTNFKYRPANVSIVQL
jgi:hypothetical protein